VDPTACLKCAADLFNAGDHAGADEALRDYAQWREHGGFEPPQVPGFGLPGDRFARNLRAKIEALR
jgi:hypothetical protein